MKLDAKPTESKSKLDKILPKRKKSLREKRESLLQMRRIGKVSMIEIGPDEYRMPNREERRRAKMRRKPVRPVTRGSHAVRVGDRERFYAEGPPKQARPERILVSQDHLGRHHETVLPADMVHSAT